MPMDCYTFVTNMLYRWNHYDPEELSHQPIMGEIEYPAFYVPDPKLPVLVETITKEKADNIIRNNRK